MQRKLIILIGLLIGGIHAQSQSKITISGTTVAKKEPLLLKAFDLETMDYKPVARVVTTSGGQFGFEVEFDEPNMYVMDLKEGSVLYLAIENPENIVVKYDGKSKAVVGGSSGTSRLREVQFQLSNLEDKYFAKLKVKMDAAMKADDKEKLGQLNEEINIQLPLFVAEMRSLIDRVETSVALYHALNYSDFNKELAYIEQKVAALKNVYPNSPVCKALELKINQAKATGVGNYPPKLVSNDINGHLVSLDNYKDKIVLVDFWASWCRACRIENPKFVELYKQYAGKLEIISISKDSDDNKWQKAIKKDGIGAWTHIWDRDESISIEYVISSLPQNIVVGKDGKVIAKNVSAEQLEKILKQL